MRLASVLLAPAFALLGCGGSSAPTTIATTPTDTSADTSFAAFEFGREASSTSITALGARLDDSDPFERTHAAHALGLAAKMGADEKTVEASLLARLESEVEPAVIKAIVWALGRSGSSASHKELAKHIGSSNSSVVAAGCLAAGVMGRRQVPISPEIRSAMVKAATSSESEVRYAAVYGLAREHEPTVDPAVTRTLEALAGDSDPEVRSTALIGLSRRGQGLEFLAAGLGDTDWRVSVSAVRGLLERKDARALAFIESWVQAQVKTGNLHAHPLRVALEGMLSLSDLSSSMRSSGLVLSHLEGKTLSLDQAQLVCLARAIYHRQGGDVGALRKCGDSVVPEYWRAAVVTGAVSANAPRPAMARQQRLAVVLEYVRSTDPRVRAAAIGPLAKLGSGPERDAVLDELRRALADRSVAVAGSAADSLGELGIRGPEEKPIFDAVATRAGRELASDGELGLTLVNTIAKLKIEAGIESCRVAATHKNRSIRAAGAACLSELSQPAVAGDPIVRAPAPNPAPVGSLRWRIKTSRGDVVIELDSSTAPRHVEAIAKLTRAKFYDGLSFHRVVPDFVVQGGDPDGTGWGGPDFVIPAEPSPLPFDRGAVGVADAGPDTGGSQWFVMHSRAPHLEGRYTRIGQVTSGMKVIDQLTVGDQIVSATIESR